MSEAMSDAVEVIRPPNRLKAKLGNRLKAFDAAAIKRAEDSLAAMSGEFEAWLQIELTKLEEAHAEINKSDAGEPELEAFYRRAHDLKGLGTTYGDPIVSQFAASLCRLVDSPEGRAKAVPKLLDTHVMAIQAAVRQQVKDTDHPIGRALLEELAGQVAKYAVDD